MRILVDAFAARGAGGGKWFTAALITELARQNRNWQFGIYCCEPSFSENLSGESNIETVVVPQASGYMARWEWQQVKLRGIIHTDRIDLLFSPMNIGMIKPPIPQVTVQRNAHHLVARVVSNGPHAEMVSVPVNLCARAPDKVSDEEAAFTVVGAIGLQGIRLARPTLGETFVVTGLGLIGQLTVQLLIAHGCRVLGIDMDQSKCEPAAHFGAEVVDLSSGVDPVEAALHFSKGRGVDGVLITAATKSSEPVHQAAQMCRKRGRIVLVGVTGLELSRADFYEKELSFQVSCSYGPGRYDPEYEEKGHDSPFGFVRWTEKRNFEAVLDMMESGRIDVKPLISHRFKFEEAEKAYELISENKEPYLGIILRYEGDRRQNTGDRRENKGTRRSPLRRSGFGYEGRTGHGERKTAVSRRLSAII